MKTLITVLILMFAVGCSLESSMTADKEWVPREIHLSEGEKWEETNPTANTTGVDYSREATKDIVTIMPDTHTWEPGTYRCKEWVK